MFKKMYAPFQRIKEHQILFNLLEVIFCAKNFLNINEENSQAVQIYVLLFQTHVINKMTTRGKSFYMT